jgi:hypothetical protein
LSSKDDSLKSLREIRGLPAILPTDEFSMSLAFSESSNSRANLFNVGQRVAGEIIIF